MIVLLRYLRQAPSRSPCRASSLATASRPGVISAHIYGLAVDIAVLDHRSIYGNQGSGGLTQKAVENILQLPAGSGRSRSSPPRPGPSFPLANHDDHIHVGY